LATVIQQSDLAAATPRCQGTLSPVSWVFGARARPLRSGHKLAHALGKHADDVIDLAGADVSGDHGEDCPRRRLRVLTGGLLMNMGENCWQWRSLRGVAAGCQPSQ
jgi:hypothetical protein